MSEVRLVIRDTLRDVHGNIHGSVADAAVAALSADPETIEELETAMERFAVAPHRGHFAWLRAGVDDTPWDAGGVIIDLVARLVASESSYSSFGHSDSVTYHNGACKAWPRRAVAMAPKPKSKP